MGTDKMTLQVSLPPADEDWIRAEVEGGRYADASDLIRRLIRKHRARTATDDEWLSDLDRAMDESAADEAAGRMESAEVVFERLRQRFGSGRAGQA